MTRRWRSRSPRTRRSAPGRSTRSAPTSRSAEWMPRLTAGEMLGAFGLTEPEAGSDAGNVRTTARLDDGEWVIDGAKQFITNSGTDISGFVTITARTGEGDEISNIIVPRGTPGYEVGEPYRKMGWNASDTRPLAFSDCRVPAENLLGPRGMGFKQFLQTLDGGRISVSAMGVGLAQGALDEALAYAKERRAFGQPIAKYQAIQMKLADMSTEIEAARLLTYKAAIEKDAGRNFNLTAAQAKLKTGPAGGPRRRGGGPDPRRLRLHRGVPRVPLLPRRQDPHDRRGHRRGPADGDRPVARGLARTWLAHAEAAARQPWLAGAPRGRPLAPPVRRLRGHGRTRRVRRLRLRRGRAPLPARRGVDRRRRRRRRERRVRGARLRDFYPYDLDRHGRETEGEAERAARRRVPAAHRARLRDRRRARRRAVPRGHRRARRGARLPAGRARGAGPVGARRRAGRRAVASLPRLRQRRLPRAERRRGDRGRGAAGRPARGARAAAYRVRLPGAARRSAVAGHEVRPGGLRDRSLRRALAAAGAPAHARGRLRRARPLQRRPVRGDQRGALRRPHALRGRRTRARPPPTRAFPRGYLGRTYRLVALFLDRDYGLLRWAPVFLLAFVGAWMLWRSRRDGLSRAVPDLRAGERVALMCCAALAAQLVVAAFLAPTMFGFWFPPRHLLAALPLAVPLVAWGLRRRPAHRHRPGAAFGGGLGLALLRTFASATAGWSRPGPMPRSGRSPARSRSSATPRDRMCSRPGWAPRYWPSPPSRPGTGATRAGATRRRYSG